MNAKSDSSTVNDFVQAKFSLKNLFTCFIVELLRERKIIHVEVCDVHGVHFTDDDERTRSTKESKQLFGINNTCCYFCN